MSGFWFLGDVGGGGGGVNMVLLLVQADLKFTDDSCVQHKPRLTLLVLSLFNLY